MEGRLGLPMLCKARTMLHPRSIAILKMDDSSVTSLLPVVGDFVSCSPSPLSSTSFLTVSLFSRSLMNLTTSIIVISSNAEDK
jgi:hypothetical protein